MLYAYPSQETKYQARVREKSGGGVSFLIFLVNVGRDFLFTPSIRGFFFSENSQLHTFKEHFLVSSLVWRRCSQVRSCLIVSCSQAMQLLCPHHGSNGKGPQLRILKLNIICIYIYNYILYYIIHAYRSKLARFADHLGCLSGVLGRL